METALKSASVTSHASVKDLQTHYNIKKGKSEDNIMQLYSYIFSKDVEICLSAVRTYVLATDTSCCKWDKLFHCTGGPLPDDSILKRRLDEKDLYVRTHRVNGKIRFGLACIVPSAALTYVPTTICQHVLKHKELPDRFLEIVAIAGNNWLRTKQLHIVQGGKWLANPTPIEPNYEYISYEQNGITVKFTPTEFMASIPVETVSCCIPGDRNLNTFDIELQVLKEQLSKIAALMKSYTS
jgi:hypothetical protein